MLPNIKRKATPGSCTLEHLPIHNPNSIKIYCYVNSDKVTSSPIWKTSLNHFTPRKNILDVPPVVLYLASVTWATLIVLLAFGFWIELRIESRPNFQVGNSLLWVLFSKARSSCLSVSAGYISLCSCGCMFVTYDNDKWQWYRVLDKHTSTGTQHLKKLNEFV